jgi:hypothetical protein
MSDAPDNLVLERLREIRAMIGRVLEDTADLKLRVGMLEAGYASMSLRLDRIDIRLERVEQRLGLMDPEDGGRRRSDRGLCADRDQPAAVSRKRAR